MRNLVLSLLVGLLAAMPMMAISQQLGPNQVRGTPGGGQSGRPGGNNSVPGTFVPRGNQNGGNTVPGWISAPQGPQQVQGQLVPNYTINQNTWVGVSSSSYGFTQNQSSFFAYFGPYPPHVVYTNYMPGTTMFTGCTGMQNGVYTFMEICWAFTQ